MNPLPQPETQPTENASELLVRMSRRGMFAMLAMILVLGATLLGQTLWPEAPASRWVEKSSWIFGLATVLLFVVLRWPLRGRAFDPRSREVQAILQDELRQSSLNRAARAALLASLLGQFPLALLFMLARLSPRQALLAMAESTILLGMVTFITLFLLFDRE